MKLSTLIYFAIFLNGFLIFGQRNENSLEINDFYYLNATFQTNLVVNYKGEKLKDKKITHKQNYLVRIINIKNDSIIFQYLKWDIHSKKATSSNTKNLTYFGDENNELFYFSLQKEVFKNFTTKYYSIFKGAVAGFYSVPFKLRFNDFDFEQNLNLGLNIGFQYRMSKKIDNKWILEPNIGFGISKINLNANNSDVTENRSASAFSTSLGLILRVTSDINLGMFLGKDFLGKNDLDTNWKYNKKTWLGLGLNVGFSISDSKKTNKVENKEEN